MPYKLTGTLIALLFYGFLFNFSLFSPPCPAHAQLFELSEIQNGIFYLSHKSMGITSETFKTDKYIDEEQARYFSELSIPEINTRLTVTILSPWWIITSWILIWRFNTIITVYYAAPCHRLPI